MIIKDEILKHLTEFKALCQNYNVIYLYAFGSSTTEHFDSEKSDVDLLIEISSKDPIERGEKLMSLWDSLEIFFRRRVELITDSSIKNPYLRKNIDFTKILIYDGKRAQIFL